MAVFQCGASRREHIKGMESIQLLILPSLIPMTHYQDSCLFLGGKLLSDILGVGERDVSFDWREMRF